MVGKIWRDVCLICINGDFGIEEGYDAEQLDLQISFRERVVDPLASLKA